MIPYLVSIIHSSSDMRDILKVIRLLRIDFIEQWPIKFSWEFSDPYFNKMEALIDTEIFILDDLEGWTQELNRKYKGEYSESMKEWGREKHFLKLLLFT